MPLFARLARLLPRLMLCVAVLTCVLSLGETGATASGVQAGGPNATASEAHGGHAGAPQAVDAYGPAASASSPLSAPSGAHGGHGGAGGVIHAVTCMSTSGKEAIVVPIALVPVAAAGLVGTQARPMPFVILAQMPRPPDRSTLCVQRV